MTSLISLHPTWSGVIRREDAEPTVGDLPADRHMLKGQRAARLLPLARGLRGVRAMLAGATFLAPPSGASATVAGLRSLASGPVPSANLRPGPSSVAAGRLSIVAGLASWFRPQTTVLASVILAGSWAVIAGLLQNGATVGCRAESPPCRRARPPRAIF